MKSVIYAIENVVAMQTFQQKILCRSSKTAFESFGPNGVFMGYDFHLTEEGPKLIEINTNAGGAFLNLLLAKAQMACCEGTKAPVELEGLEDKFFDIFEDEWRSQKKNQELKVIAIMDENPNGQFLYPEFKLFADLFKKKGISTFIVDPSLIELRYDGLWFQNNKIDLVYNRSTDFYFDAEIYEGIKAAYLAGNVVITPNPHHHALFADKENLEILTSREEMRTLGIETSVQEVLLKGIPRTFKVTETNRSEFWARRKNYFFKPTKGYGSKATYRGDKITLRVWEEMANSSYIAQELTPPGLRLIENEGKQIELKQDIRVYAYSGEILLLASRLYMGQTTNFRTEGGGFAPVFVI
ncbi:MAG: hypothetical protein K2P81_14660 [Bacteriovoracaceae bacterium]|nr:hypothetical protein [Bacteriovoracaceae bacterium]